MIYSIGHSTMDEKAFLKVIEPVDIVLDIRSHPGSKWPQFQKEAMEIWLPKAGKVYEWEPRLGGWTKDHASDKAMVEKMAKRGIDIMAYSGQKFPKQRIAKTREAKSRTKPEWTNVGLYDYSFYETLPEFFVAAEELIERGKTMNIGIMCCEVLWWKCHRSMVADYLATRGVEVVHLQPKLTPHSKAIGDRLLRYHGDVVRAWKKPR